MYVGSSSRISDFAFYYSVVLPYNIYHGKNKQTQFQEHIERAISLEKERIFSRDSYFLSAVDYFNDVVLKAKELQWEHFFELVRRLKGEIRSKKRLALRSWSADKNNDLLKLINTQCNSRDKVINKAISIFNEIVNHQIFAGLRGFYEPIFFGENNGYQGHHRTAWLVTNFFLINNGYQPFYFKDSNEAHGSGNHIRHQLLEDRLVKA